MRETCLDEQTRLDARELLCEGKAAEEPLLLVLVERRNLFATSNSEYSAVAEVVVHGEPDPETGAVRDRMACEEAVRAREKERGRETNRRCIATNGRV